MKNAGITVILVGVAVAGFAGYEGLKWLEKQNAPTAADVTKQVDAVRAEAAQKHPGMSQTDAMKKVAAAKAADTMRETSPGQRSRVAAEAVFGAYFMNTRVRQAHCKQLGVEIAGFASALRAHPCRGTGEGEGDLCRAGAFAGSIRDAAGPRDAADDRTGHARHRPGARDEPREDLQRLQRQC